LQLIQEEKMAYLRNTHQHFINGGKTVEHPQEYKCGSKNPRWFFFSKIINISRWLTAECLGSLEFGVPSHEEPRSYSQRFPST
jgi:hypothetical protein